MVQLFYTTYISVDFAHHEIFCARFGKGGIKQCKESENLDKSVKSLCCLLITFADSLNPDQAQQKGRS